jgi:hypothetical protein
MLTTGRINIVTPQQSVTTTHDFWYEIMLW